MNEEYGHIPDGFFLNPEEIQELRIEDLENLANLIEAQGNEFLQRTETLMKEAQERPGGDLDAL